MNKVKQWKSFYRIQILTLLKIQYKMETIFYVKLRLKNKTYIKVHMILF